MLVCRLSFRFGLSGREQYGHTLTDEGNESGYMTARIRGDAEALVALENEYGSRYLDCLSAYSAVNHGHRHPNILAATHEQAARVTLTFRACRTEQLAPFCQKLAQFCGMDTVFPMNTGAETVETAIEAAITPNSCAVLLEPIQCEAGILIPPAAARGGRDPDRLVP